MRAPLHGPLQEWVHFDSETTTRAKCTRTPDRVGIDSLVDLLATTYDTDTHACTCEPNAFVLTVHARTHTVSAVSVGHRAVGFKK